MVQTNDNSTSTTMHLPPPKRKRALSKSVLKSYAMSGSLTLNLIATKSMNPRNCPPNSSILYDCNNAHLNSAAETIQIFARKREIRHAEEMMKRTILDQTYRVSIVKYLSNYITTNTCEKLLLGSDDSEILKTFSLYDKRHIEMKARHVADALQALLSCTEKNIATTWIRCCEISVKKNYNQVKRARTIADWYLDLHKTKSLKWRRSERGVIILC